MKITLYTISTSAILLLIFISSIGCAGFRTASEQWEGISNNTLRITIAEFFPFEEIVTNDEIKIQIKEKLNQRATLIIASHLSINLDRKKINGETDVLLNKLINNAISTGTLSNYECSENNYCTAFSEYDITELQKNLETINNQ